MCNLDYSATQLDLRSIFSYHSPRTAFVVRDKADISKGFGFVKFLSNIDQTLAIDELDGEFFMNRPMRVESSYM